MRSATGKRWCDIQFDWEIFYTWLIPGREVECEHFTGDSLPRVQPRGQGPAVQEEAQAGLPLVNADRCYTLQIKVLHHPKLFFLIFFRIIFKKFSLTWLSGQDAREAQHSWSNLPWHCNSSSHWYNKMKKYWNKLLYLLHVTEPDFNPKKISGVLSSLIDVSGHLEDHDPSKYALSNHLLFVFQSFFS